jgi:hypothetical protein
MKDNSNKIIYQNENGNIKVDVLFQDGSVWLNHSEISEVFGKSKSTISEHIKAIFQHGELRASLTVRNYKNLDYYNLEMITAIGFRVRSSNGIKFRIWANEKLKEYIANGFVVADERPKNVNSIGHFGELEIRLREIRLSESLFEQKIKEIYMTSLDYDSEDKNSIEFFQILQKHEDQTKFLGLLVEQLLIFAEMMAVQQTPMFMKDWIARLDTVISLSERELLIHTKEISYDLAKAKLYRL